MNSVNTRSVPPKNTRCIPTHTGYISREKWDAGDEVGTQTVLH